MQSKTCRENPLTEQGCRYTHLPYSAPPTARKNCIPVSPFSRTLIQSPTPLSPPLPSSLIAHSPHHNQPIRNHIPDPQPKRRPAHPPRNKLHNQNRRTPRQAPRQQRKPQKQDQSSLPRDTVSTVAKRVGGQARFVDGIYDEHAQGAADAGDPVDEGDVDGRVGAVEARGGPDGDVDLGVEC